MQLSLGFIETDSFFGAVEASNIMAKTSDIILLGKEVFSSGTVTVKIIGENEDVKAAVKAGVQAIKNLEKKVSSHVIEEIDEQLLSVLPEISNFYFRLKKFSKEKNGEDITAIPGIEKEIINDEPEDLSSNQILEDTKPEAEKPIKNIIRKENSAKEKKIIKHYKNDTIERLRKEALGLDKPLEKKKEKKKKETQKEEDNTSDLDSLNVHQLRRLARSTVNFPIQGREISKANRGVLLNYFKSLK